MKTSPTSVSYRLRTFFVPPRSAYYQFYFATDDMGELWLSTVDGNASAATKVRIVQKPTDLYSFASE